MSDKKIDTLIEDIYDVVDKGTEVSEEDRSAFARDLERVVSERLSSPNRDKYLRVSNLGQCDRRLYFEINHPDVVEPLQPSTKLKFLIGDMWEAVLLFLARAAGHKVEGEQDEIDINGVKGHRDAVIDGVLVDVKSASSRAFKKFEEGLTSDKDDFGYLTQLDTYLSKAEDDPVITDTSRAAFLAGDKTLGHITLDFHDKTDTDYDKIVDQKREMLADKNPPKRPYDDVPDGKSGNRKLGVVCSYCPVKFACWGNLKQYNYSGGPRYLTKVVREPRVEAEGTATNDPF